MKITVRALRKMINEVGLSPSVFKNNKTVSDPMKNANVSKGYNDMVRFFGNSLEMDLVLSMSDKYNSETREFDDAAYQTIKNACQTAQQKVSAAAHDALESAWKEAHDEVSGQTGKTGQ